ncbi:hypothetical protein ACIQOW_03630 [Kitasatospora sp. NPDC091335]|uniref:hypothetical protein n=1 Tax=Kitasatospora sp. NPDC091335 TaxID=3364085 RepID=UPI0037F301D7
MSPLTIGAWHDAELHGIAGPWTVAGHATIWDLTTNPDGTPYVLVEISTPSGLSHTPHYTYAHGCVNVFTDDRIEITQVVTPQPGPDRIVLSPEPDCLLDPADAAYHRARAVSVLTDWQPIPDDDSPLDVSALPWLARATQRAAEKRAAERERNHLVRRLDAGGVPRTDLARTIGRHPSRIAQLRDTACAKVSA